MSCNEITSLYGCLLHGKQMSSYVLECHIKFHIKTNIKVHIKIHHSSNIFSCLSRGITDNICMSIDSIFVDISMDLHCMHCSRDLV